MYQVGFTTGTFDLVHKRHFEVLRFMKQRCVTLIVGLTSDELGEKQKRRTVMNFEQRSSILEACKYVDFVIVHNGETKDEMFLKIQFNVLFIGYEYYGSQEYSSFAKTPVIYVPQTSINVHTSQHVKLLEYNNLQQVSILTSGISGSLLQYKSNDSWYVIKPVHIGNTEKDMQTFDKFGKSLKTANCYDLPFPNVPRNWKRLNHVNTPNSNLPNIAGVNGYREIEFHELFKREWIPTISCKKVYFLETDEKRDICEERRYPVEIYWLYMKYAGISLTKWIDENSNQLNFIVNLNLIIEQVLKYIGEMRSLDIIHGDIHTDNILVDDNLKVSLIDFGWCYHPSFYLVGSEYDYYKSLLKENFDLVHFYDSLKYKFSTEPWFLELTFIPNE